MTTYYGCDPDDLRALTDTVVEKVRRILDLFTTIDATSAAVSWQGPDAQTFREQIAQTVAEGRDTARTLSLRGRELQVQAAAQDATSAPGDDGARDGNPFSGLWSELPGGGSGESRGPVDLTGIGRPLAWEGDPEDVAGFAKGTARNLHDVARGLLDSEELTVEEGGLRYEQEHLDHGEAIRTGALGKAPFLGPLQSAVGIQERLENGVADGEDWLVANGHEEFLPLTRSAEAGLSISGIAFGEESVAGQTFTSIDGGIANVFQTSENVSGELREGDGMGAVRELEYGLLRHGANQSTLLTATPMEAVLGAGETVFGASAEASDRYYPQPVTDTLQGTSEFFGESKDDYSALRDVVTDPEIWIRERREHAPMPWDPESAA